MLTLMSVVLLEIFLYILRPGAGAELPVTAVALFYIGWAMIVLRAAWWELGNRFGFAHHIAHEVSLLWVLLQSPAYLMAVEQILPQLSNPITENMLAMVYNHVLPFGIMATILVDARRVQPFMKRVYQRGRRW